MHEADNGHIHNVHILLARSDLDINLRNKVRVFCFYNASMVYFYIIHTFANRWARRLCFGLWAVQTMTEWK